MYIVLTKYVQKQKKKTMVVNYALRELIPPYFTFIPTEKIVLKHARRSETHPSHKTQPHA